MGRFLLVLIAGCGFRGPGLLGQAGGDGGVDAPVPDSAIVDAGETDAAILDARPIDAHPVDAQAVDARPDAPAVTVYETLTIPGAGGVVNSSFVPAVGVTYHLRASGFVQVASGLDSDAEYWGFPNGMNDLTSDGLVDMGLGIDDTLIDTVKTRWGPYTPTHVYVIAYLGTGVPLRAQYEDNYFGNNTGTMTLEILP